MNMSGKQLNLMIALVLPPSMLFTTGAFALNYSGSQGIEGTYKTPEEMRTGGP